MSSLSKAVVFRVKDLKDHPNADNLKVSEFDGCPYIVNKNDTYENDLRIFVPFDMCCPDEPWVGDFVRGKRVRPMRLRGVFSMAVCLPLPEGCGYTEGVDVTELLGFTKWEPPEVEERDGVTLENSDSGYSCKGPSGLTLSKYDLESLRKYHSVFTEGEPVIISEKLDGENISIVYWEDQLHVRSRNRWIAEGDNKWWLTVGKYDWQFLKDNPGLVAQGEKYGNVNKFRYDCVNGEQKIRLFDVYDATRGVYLDDADWKIKLLFYKNTAGFAPELYKGPWLGIAQHKHLAEGKSTLADHIREGFVVQPLNERYDYKLGRVKLKLHGESYLIAKGKQK